MVYYSQIDVGIWYVFSRHKRMDDTDELVAHHRFLHFHGQHGVRLSQTQTIHGEAKGGRSFLITLLSPFLFYAPDAHSNSLDLIWVDELVSHDAWGVFIETLNSEWIEFILYVCDLPVMYLYQ